MAPAQRVGVLSRADRWLWHRFLEDRDRFWASLLVTLTVFFAAFITTSPVARAYWDGFARCGWSC